MPKNNLLGGEIMVLSN